MTITEFLLSINPWWLWAAGIISGLFFGALITFIISAIIFAFKGRYAKYRAPKNMDDKVLLNPGKPVKKDIKEVDDDERNKYNEFREFERLRRLGSGKTEYPSTASLYTGDLGNAKRTAVQDESIKISRNDKSGNNEPSKDNRRVIEID